MGGLSGARCVGQGPLFESVELADHMQAKAICAECPAIKACAQLLREVCDGEGTWAGMLVGAPKARRPLGRKPQPREHGSERGYQQHRKRTEKACSKCLEGHRFHVWLRTRYAQPQRNPQPVEKSA